VKILTCPIEEENLFYLKLHIDVKIMGTVRILRTFIQGDSGGICNTLGNDSMCDYK
jgi:hypothetical protein